AVPRLRRPAADRLREPRRSPAASGRPSRAPAFEPPAGAARRRQEAKAALRRADRLAQWRTECGSPHSWPYPNKLTWMDLVDAGKDRWSRSARLMSAGSEEVLREEEGTRDEEWRHSSRRPMRRIAGVKLSSGPICGRSRLPGGTGPARRQG